MQGVLVQRQHEDNEDKESVKNREEEHTLVSKFLQIVLDFRLETKTSRIYFGNVSTNSRIVLPNTILCRSIELN